MATKESIIELADRHIRQDGYNAFSFKDISHDVGIKTSSIHYYFPTKTDLGVATIDWHIGRVQDFIKAQNGKSPLEKLEAFMGTYRQIMAENKVCLMGSLCCDLNTVAASMKSELKKFGNIVLDWVTEFLEDGRQQGYFHFQQPARTRTVMVIASIMASVQLSRVYGQENFELVTNALINDLTTGKI